MTETQAINLMEAAESLLSIYTGFRKLPEGTQGRSAADNLDAAIKEIRNSTRWAKMEPVTQGTVLPDGSIVGVIIAPFDVQQIAEDNYTRQITLEQAGEWLAEHAAEVSDALVEGWADVLGNLDSLQEFASAEGELINEEED